MFLLVEAEKAGGVVIEDVALLFGGEEVGQELAADRAHRKVFADGGAQVHDALRNGRRALLLRTRSKQKQKGRQKD